MSFGERQELWFSVLPGCLAKSDVLSVLHFSETFKLCASTSSGVGL